MLPWTHISPLAQRQVLHVCSTSHVTLLSTWLTRINNRHKCKDQTKIESCNIVAGGPCSVIGDCRESSTCIDIPNHWGVACKKSRPSTGREVRSASSSMTPAKRDVSVDGRKCTKTRRGVFTCINEFCAVRPGDWCKDKESCHDDCTCCRKPRVANTIYEVCEDAPIAW